MLPASSLRSLETDYLRCVRVRVGVIGDRREGRGVRRREGDREGEGKTTLHYTTLSQCYDMPTVLTPIIPFPSILIYSYFQGLAVDRIICHT